MESQSVCVLSFALAMLSPAGPETAPFDLRKMPMAKFKLVYIPPYAPEGKPTSAYGYEDVHLGDVLELYGPLAEKARGNSSFEEVSEKTKGEKK